MNQQSLLFEILNNLKVQTQTFTHKQVFTCEEALTLKANLPKHGPIKNLFLKDKKKRFWLLSALHDTTIKLKELAKSLQAPELRFARPDELLTYLGVEPGSVTPFGLINDKEHSVHVILDQKIFEHELIGIHPLINSATTLIKPKDLQTFITELGYQPTIIDFSGNPT